MKRIKLKMQEDRKYQVIKNVANHQGNKKRAALSLGITTRQVNRLLIKYRSKGKAAFVHGNKNRQPVNCLSTEINKQIVTLYQNKYQDCNFRHYTELLGQREHIQVSYASVYSRLLQAGIYPPKLWRSTRKKRAKASRGDHNREANHYLTATFIPNFNQEFGHSYRQTVSAFGQAPDDRKINYN
ncbi:helix-turn-helix domain-containing protein [Lactobacillus acetotolerans]|jgi:transposase|uniref:Transposase n=1 Tax=Lactobacillus acetotolerans TaxID=1600 RepID=A0A0D6A561_9LACO|nr:helix-turn-helix domain-containing protein [Lactobacillus acetotolerans]MBN7276231.1 helix-turn-helix domain-containing protein [Lactobacillus acetotolerans]QJD72894.1 helix-turn-helix domain-containing protein [Lactobacillus acetotolerans]BAQ57963.1 transposase [Lactobacillus acetotolerans]HBG91203.1 helix-turn-helix domain-containing protein [Lactobacillus acetotolerans]HCX40024.1 helix-turn-helix domain-containing protein [Lactobacillus acetotolerans]